MIPPATTVFGVPLGWSDLPSVTVTLSALDSGSSVAYTMYTINGSVPQTYTAATPIVVSSEGTNTLTYWSVDTAPTPNREETRTAYVRLDRSGPTVQTQLVPLTGGPVRVTLAAQDALSGVDDFVYSIDGIPQAPVAGPPFTASFTLSVPGTHTVTYQLWDTTGNEATGSVSVFVKDGFLVSKSPAAPTVIASRRAGRVVWRPSVAVRARVTGVEPFGTGIAPVAGKRVALQKWNGRAWVNQRIATTSSRGIASVALTLTRAERSYWRWYIPGDEGHASVVSARTLLVVR